MVTPIIGLLVVFGLYPLARTIQISFTDWDGLSSTFHYIGAGNYLKALDDDVWWLSIGHGLLFAAVALTVMQGIGLMLALGVDQKIRGQSTYRVLFYLPPVLSGIVVAIVWKWLYQPYGGGGALGGERVAGVGAGPRQIRACALPSLPHDPRVAGLARPGPGRGVEPDQPAQPMAGAPSRGHGLRPGMDLRD